MSIAQQRWQVIIAGILSLITMVGIARFAYTPMIPVMFSQSSLSVAESGWLAAVNYFGYLLGAVITAKIKRIEWKDTLFRWALVIGVITTLMMGLADNVWVWAISRFFAGLSATGGMLLASALVMHWLVRHNFRPEIGLHFSGMGFGIVVAALLVDFSLPFFSWEEQWYLMTIVSCVLSTWAWRWLPKATSHLTDKDDQRFSDKPPSTRFLRLFQLAYFFSGIGYAVSATYISATIQTLPGMHNDGALVFLLVGIGGIPAAYICDRLARRIGLFHALCTTLLIKALGISLTIVANYPILPMLGAMMFGYGFIGIVNLVLTIAGRYYPSMPGKMMGVMTISYGLSQMIAPAVTGYLAAMSGHYIGGTLLAILSVLISLSMMLYLARQADAKLV